MRISEYENTRVREYEDMIIREYDERHMMSKKKSGPSRAIDIQKDVDMLNRNDTQKEYQKAACNEKESTCHEQWHKIH